MTTEDATPQVANKPSVLSLTIKERAALYAANKPLGIGVQFSAENGGQEAMSKIESILGSALKSSRPTHTM